jgi:hypothetical protein
MDAFTKPRSRRLLPSGLEVSVPNVVSNTNSASWPWECPAASQSWGLSYQPVPKAVPSPCLIWPRVIKMRRPVLRQELRQRVEKTSAV